MRSVALGLLILLLSGCDDKRAVPSGAPSATTTATASAPPVASASASADAGPSPLVMPERPIPKPQSTIGASSPIDVQQRAIAYFMAMKAPRPDDASADPAYAAELAKTLGPIVMSMDTGGDKAKMNRVEVQANGRQIDLLMAGGCDAKTPMRAVVTRANVSFATLVSHGVFVVRCNDAHWQCLQSTRDPDDVLCATGIRHK